MADDIKIELVLDSQGVVKGLKKVEGKGKDTGEKLGKGIASGVSAKAALIGGAVAAAIGGVAIISAVKKLKDVFVDVVEAAIVQDDAVKKLNNSLITTGQYSEETSRDLQNFASQLQNVTTFGDEGTLAQLAFAQSLGATAEQSKSIVN